MLLPEYLKHFFPRTGGLIESDMTFPKKKDAECHVHLIAVRRLYMAGLYGEDLYPNINRFLNRRRINDCLTPNSNPEV